MIFFLGNFNIYFVKVFHPIRQCQKREVDMSLSWSYTELSNRYYGAEVKKLKLLQPNYTQYMKDDRLQCDIIFKRRIIHEENTGAKITFNF
jgi:hypothetical protein